MSRLSWPAVALLILTPLFSDLLHRETLSAQAGPPPSGATGGGEAVAGAPEDVSGSGLPFSYDFETEDALSRRIDPDNPDPEFLKEVFSRRRERVLESIPAGGMLVFSVEWLMAGACLNEPWPTAYASISAISASP